MGLIFARMISLPVLFVPLVVVFVVDIVGFGFFCDNWFKYGELDALLEELTFVVV